MNGQAQQIDYDALAEQARKQTSAPAGAPRKTKSATPVVDYDALAAQARQPAPAAPATDNTPPPDFTTNSVNPATGTGYGLYRMGSYDFNEGQVTKPEIQVPFNRVQDAIAAGYKLHPDEDPRHENDVAHNGPVSRAASSVKSFLSRMTEPAADAPAEGPIWQKALAAESNAANLPVNVVNRFARAMVSLVPGVAQSAWDFTQGRPEGFDPAAMAENSYKGFQQDRTDLGPVAALGNLGGDALTMYAAGKLGGKAGDTTNAVVRGAGDAAQGVIRRLAGTGPGVARELVRQTEETNRNIARDNVSKQVEAQRNWEEKQAEADAAHKKKLADLRQKFEADQREGAWQARVGTAEDQKAYWDKRRAAKQKYDQDTRDQVARYTADRAKAEQANAEAAQKVAENNAKAAQKVTDANTQTSAKHQAVTQRIQAANQAAENMLGLRRQHEEAHQQATDTHYAKEAAADTKAKAEENQAWSAWRQKTMGKTLDGGQISNPLQKLRLDSPEVDRTLNQLEPRGDEVPQESPYAQIRERTSQQHFGKDYQSLSPVKQDEIDDLLHAGGYTPEPIAFDPQAGQPISIDRVQRASSILQRYIRSGRFEGPLLGEMKQVAGILRNAVTRASADAGAAPELDSARNATITYQGAFGRELKTPNTARTIREQQVNPEAFQAREDEARLARARRYDPTLVDSYRQVKSAREALDKFPPEDQLRKGLRQISAPPTVGDTRSGFRLQPEAIPVDHIPKPVPTAADYKAPVKPSPVEAKMPPPLRKPPKPLPPDELFRSAPVVPYKEPRLTSPETISYDDMQRANERGFNSRGHALTNYAMRVAGVLAPLRMLGEFLRTGSTPLRPMTTIPAAGMAGLTVEELMSNPGIIDFFSKPTRQQLAAIPQNLKGQMPAMVEAARTYGISVSPLVAAYAATVQRNRNRQQPSPQQQPLPAGAAQ